MSDYEYFGLAPGASSSRPMRRVTPRNFVGVTFTGSDDSARLYDEHCRRVRRTRARIHAETLKERVAEKFAQLNRAGIVLDFKPGEIWFGRMFDIVTRRWQ